MGQEKLSVEEELAKLTPEQRANYEKFKERTLKSPAGFLKMFDLEGQAPFDTPDMIEEVKRVRSALKEKGMDVEEFHVRTITMLKHCGFEVADSVDAITNLVKESPLYYDRDLNGVYLLGYHQGIKTNSDPATVIARMLKL